MADFDPVAVSGEPSLAGSTGSEMPGVGTFNYRGAPVGMLASRMIAQLGR